MPTKWLAHAPWRQKQEAPNGNSTRTPVPSVAASDAAPEKISPAVEPGATAARTAHAGTHGDLLSMEDIYRAAGIMNPRMGYSITKVADMLVSDHIRGLSDTMKRASVLMALDAAGIPVEDVLCDAALRQDAVDAYEASQRKHFEEFWARMDEENALVRAELDRATAQYLDRIKRNLDEVAWEKAAFAAWQTMKQQELQRIAEAIAVCAKPAPAEAPAAKPQPSEPPTPSLRPSRGLAATSKPS
jgi:hypothetical protein